jgi:RimJ/RimL family protein N-acetyltransferase
MTWVNDPEVTFYFAHLSRTISKDEESRVVEQLMESKTDIIYSIFEDDVYVGQIGLSKIYWPAKNARLGAMLCRNAWGRGLISKAARLVLEKAFSEHGLHKVWLITRSDNAKGLHIWQSVGFQQEGVLRDEYRVQDRYYDMVRYGLLASDFHLATKKSRL